VLLIDEDKSEEELVKGALDRESSEGWSSGSFSFSSDMRTVLILGLSFTNIVSRGLRASELKSAPCRFAAVERILLDFKARLESSFDRFDVTTIIWQAASSYASTRKDLLWYWFLHRHQRPSALSHGHARDVLQSADRSTSRPGKELGYRVRPAL
jgi:hypothetical protein